MALGLPVFGTTSTADQASILGSSPQSLIVRQGTIYDRDSADPFGGVYSGSGDTALTEMSWRYPRFGGLVGADSGQQQQLLRAQNNSCSASHCADPLIVVEKSP